MGTINKITGPVFMKGNDNAQLQVERLRQLKLKLNAEGQNKISQQIRHLEYGIIGEDNIVYELKNCSLPMYIIQDLKIRKDDYTAQIDFIIFTKKICFVVECKNLYGNIEINSNGDFLRTMEYNGNTKQVGFYSPITQNNRHLSIMKKFDIHKKVSIFGGKGIFENYTKSIIVLANPKTVLNATYAKKEVKEQVIRADQLSRYIEEAYNQSYEYILSDKKLYEWASAYYSLHIETDMEDMNRYTPYLKAEESKAEPKTRKSDQQEVIGEVYQGVAPDKYVKKIFCDECSGNYIIRSGQYGEFAGCSNYPRCKSKKNMTDYILSYIKKYGINIYAWNRHCWKCGNIIKIYSYFLNYDLEGLDQYFEGLSNIGLGDIPILDNYLSQKYETIGLKYSKTVNKSYISNYCEHCGSIQGKNYVVDDPHEIIREFTEHTLEQYIVENVTFESAKITANDIKALIYN